MDGWGFRIGAMCDMIAYTANETLAFHLNIDRCGHVELNATTKGVDIYLFVLRNYGLTQVQSDATAESIEPGTVERFAMIDILVAAIVY